MNFNRLSLLFVSVAAITPTSLYAAVFQDPIVHAAYCSGVISAQYEVSRSDIPNGVNGKPLLASDGKPIVPGVLNNPYYLLPDKDALLKKLSALRLNTKNYEAQSISNANYVSAFSRAGKRDFNSETIIEALNCRAWTDPQQKANCIRIVAPNAALVSDCLK